MCSFHHSPFPHSFESSRTGFLAHLISYLTVNAGLLLINLLTAPEAVWAIWPLFGWGLGVLSHGLHLLTNNTRSPASSAARTSSEKAPDWARIEKRLQNLEAIVADDDLDPSLQSSPSRSGTSSTR